MREATPPTRVRADLCRTSRRPERPHATRVALDTGFHSLVEVFLRAGVPQEGRNSALRTAIFARRLELAQLLVEYGADPHSSAVGDTFDSRCQLIRWIITRGIDMEERSARAHHLLRRDEPDTCVRQEIECLLG